MLDASGILRQDIIMADMNEFGGYDVAECSLCYYLACRFNEGKKERPNTSTETVLLLMLAGF